MSWMEESILSKCLYYPRQSTHSMGPLSPMAFFTELEKNFTILHENTKTPQIDKAILRKKNRAGGMKFSDFGLYYKPTVIKTVWYWHKNRSTDQWNRTESPEINTPTYGQIIYDKGGKNIW